MVSVEFVSGKYEYERRTQRIISGNVCTPSRHRWVTVEGRRSGPLGHRVYWALLIRPWLPHTYTTLVHRLWLCVVAGILHQDLSLKNIVYRVVEGQIYDVLTDYDLPYWRIPCRWPTTTPRPHRDGSGHLRL